MMWHRSSGATLATEQIWALAVVFSFYILKNLSAFSIIILPELVSFIVRLVLEVAFETTPHNRKPQMPRSARKERGNPFILPTGPFLGQRIDFQDYFLYRIRFKFCKPKIDHVLSRKRCEFQLAIMVRSFKIKNLSRKL